MNTENTDVLTPILVIPARMASTRLPGKPLADIGGVPMIVHVMQRALAANLGPVVIACAETEVAEAVRAAGGVAIMTDPNLPSGTDRIRIAVETLDPEGKMYNCVVNVQGDLPTLDPLAISAVVGVLEDVPTCDIATLVVATHDPREISDPNVVKAVLSLETEDRGRALYFTRARAPAGDGPVYHHIGLYAYRRAALDRFCALRPSPLEKRERLEQLRALEDNMRIDAKIVTHAPEGVDTPEDLARARRIILGETS
ncbi:MAG: 3-deoxy-manno-octulosonate cytidylyltransferase [Robiginitomaculum sp.]|nr:MAG: 3-deoxy-manno-octulosonate cytidylyltransferase [Robiginitomaculum sp.]